MFQNQRIYDMEAWSIRSRFLDKHNSIVMYSIWSRILIMCIIVLWYFITRDIKQATYWFIFCPLTVIHMYEQWNVNKNLCQSTTGFVRPDLQTDTFWLLCWNNFWIPYFFVFRTIKHLSSERLPTKDPRKWIFFIFMVLS